MHDSVDCLALYRTLRHFSPLYTTLYNLSKLYRTFRIVQYDTLETGQYNFAEAEKSPPSLPLPTLVRKREYVYKKYLEQKNILLEVLN